MNASGDSHGVKGGREFKVCILNTLAHCFNILTLSYLLSSFNVSHLSMISLYSISK